MIRPLHPFDVVRYALAGSPSGSNRVHPFDSLGNKTRSQMRLIDTARLSVLLHVKSTCAFAQTHGTRIVGISAASPRSGHRTWEFTQFFHASEDELSYTTLLRTNCQGITHKGGERVFVRLRNEDPLIGITRRCGFVLCTHELLFRWTHRAYTIERPITVREKNPTDEYSLFRLYNAATPSETRLATGMTFEQWASSREQGGGHYREYVYEKYGILRGWIGINQSRRVARVTAMIHPEEETNIVSLMDYGLSRLKGAPTVHCIVQKHQTALLRLLTQRCYEMTAEYVTLVKSMVTSTGNREARLGMTIAPT